MKQYSKSELWSEIKRQSPSLADWLTRMRKEFGEYGLRTVVLRGVRYR